MKLYSYTVDIFIGIDLYAHFNIQDDCSKFTPLYAGWLKFIHIDIFIVIHLYETLFIYCRHVYRY